MPLGSSGKQTQFFFLIAKYGNGSFCVMVPCRSLFVWCHAALVIYACGSETLVFLIPHQLHEVALAKGFYFVITDLINDVLHKYIGRNLQGFFFVGSLLVSKVERVVCHHAVKIQAVAITRGIRIDPAL
ncbi:hypothetical protein D3C81_1053500 [compost metagenome]